MHLEAPFRLQWENGHGYPRDAINDMSSKFANLGMMSSIRCISRERQIINLKYSRR
jgi:hypothetical protein